MTTRPVVPCPRRAEGCQGECVTAMLVGQQVVIVNGGQWLTVCSTCRAFRAVGENTAKRLPTLLLTGNVANDIRQRIRFKQAETRGYIRVGRN